MISVRRRKITRYRLLGAQDAGKREGGCLNDDEMEQLAQKTRARRQAGRCGARGSKRHAGNEWSQLGTEMSLRCQGTEEHHPRLGGIAWDRSTLQLYLKPLRAEMLLEKQTRIEIFASFQTKQMPDSRAERGTESRRVQGQFSVSGHLGSLSLQEMTTAHFRILTSPWESRSITPALARGIIIQEVAWPHG